MSDDIRETARRIADSAHVVDWIEDKLKEERLREVEADNDKAKALLQSRGWKVCMIGQSWAVGFGGRREHSFFGVGEDGNVVTAARKLVSELRDAAKKLEGDLVP